MCGIPIITNASPELVKDVDCGILVDYDDVEQIRAAVTSLSDLQLRTRLGRNGRAAFLGNITGPKWRKSCLKFTRT